MELYAHSLSNFTCRRYYGTYFSCIDATTKLISAASRTILKKIPQLPYTVVLLVIGALFGVVSSNFDTVKDYTTLARMDPHTTLHVFLPVLIFESAYAMEAHTFFKSFIQIMVLAILGLGKIKVFGFSAALISGGMIVVSRF